LGHCNLCLGLGVALGADPLNEARESQPPGGDKRQRKAFYLISKMKGKDNRKSVVWLERHLAMSLFFL